MTDLSTEQRNRMDAIQAANTARTALAIAIGHVRALPESVRCDAIVARLQRAWEDATDAVCKLAVDR